MHEGMNRDASRRPSSQTYMRTVALGDARRHIFHEALTCFMKYTGVKRRSSYSHAFSKLEFISYRMMDPLKTQII